MNKVKRFNSEFRGMIERPGGHFVFAADYYATKAERDALAAENAELKELYRQSVKELDDTCFEIGMMRGEKSMEYPVPQTPATDAYLNSVRAEGLEMWVDQLNGVKGWTVSDAENFAAQLRAGKDGE